MRRNAVFVLLAVAAVLAGTAGVAAAAPWQKLSPDDVLSIDGSSLTVNGGRVYAAWPSGSGFDLAGTISFRGFAPTATAPLAGAGPVAAAATGFSNVSSRPAIVVAGVPAGLRVITGGTIEGRDHQYVTAPLSEGAAQGVPATIISEAFNGPMDAVALPDGGTVVANAENGVLHTFRDAVPVDGTDLQAPLGGCCSYHPAIGRDGTGRVWVAWYSNAAGHVGIFVQQLDPASGAPLGPFALVPQSQSVANNTSHLALACSAATCRIVYAAQPTATDPLRVASWAPGESGPTTVAIAGSLGLNGSMGAAFRPNGTLWSVWYDNGATSGAAGFYATLGNARGAGGERVKIGRPAGFVASGDIEAAVLGENLVVVSTVNTGRTRAALWTTVVQPPDQVVDNPRTIRNGPATVVAPKGVSLTKLKRTKCVNVRLTATQPARILVAIFSGTKSVRIFGQKVVTFPAPGTRVVCVRVPFRAKTFNVRTPAKIAVAVRKGARRRQGEPPATVVTKGFRFF